MRDNKIKSEADLTDNGRLNWPNSISLNTMLRLMRVARNLTQSQVEELTGISKFRISRIETGRYQARPVEVKSIKKALGFDKLSIL